MQDKYYSNGQLLSYHKLLNFLIGHRGVGKTYDFKKWAIKDFIKTGSQFVWVRRYKAETKEQCTNEYMLEDIRGCFPKNKLSMKGSETNGEILADGKVAGYYLTLSVSSKYKSRPFPRVDKIIFDEFLIDKSTYRYLKNEVVVFLDLIETIFRDRDNVKGVYCIGNNISFTNPYFLYFHILPFNQRFYKRDQVICENYKNQIYIENKKNTRFGKLIAGTQYEKYAVENNTLLDTDTFIAPRSPNAKFKFYVSYKSNKIGFWTDMNEGIMYACREYDPTTYAKYCLTKEDHEPNLFLIKNIKNTHINDLKFMFQNGLLRFSDGQVKNLCYEILAYFIR